MQKAAGVVLRPLTSFSFRLWAACVACCLDGVHNPHTRDSTDRTSPCGGLLVGCDTPGLGGVWHISDCLPLAAPIGLSPLLILTLCGPERVLVVSTEPPDDLSCLTTPGVGGRGRASCAWAPHAPHPTRTVKLRNACTPTEHAPLLTSGRCRTSWPRCTWRTRSCRRHSTRSVRGTAPEPHGRRTSPGQRGRWKCGCRAPAVARLGGPSPSVARRQRRVPAPNPSFPPPQAPSHASGLTISHVPPPTLHWNFAGAGVGGTPRGGGSTCEQRDNGPASPFLPSRIVSPRPLGCSARAPHLSQDPAPFTPSLLGSPPPPPFTRGGSPPQKANTYGHPEAPTGGLAPPCWHTPSPSLSPADLTPIRD